jgi:predicted PurR-regulated permease PerM
MMTKPPFYFKSTLTLLGLVLICAILYLLADILIPISLSIMIALMLNPLVNRFQRWKIPHALAIFLAMLIAIIAFLALGYFLTSQIISFGNDLPVLKQKFTALFAKGQLALVNHFNIPVAKQNQWFSEAENGIKPILSKLMGSALGVMSVTILLPVYTFLFLYYKKLLLNFLYEVFAESNASYVGEVLEKTKGAIQSYALGLLIEGLIVAALNSIALLLLGVKYAILLAVIGAIVNVLPFIGGIIALIPPVIVATITKDGMETQLGVVISYIVIQFTDNHFLVPFIVSSKVKINALISIVAVLLGGALWGIAGMFLSIPFVGVLKIIFDRITDLKPWGKLLGDEIPTIHKGQLWRRRRKKTLVQ